MIKQSVINQIPFRYVLSDVRFASAENMMFIRHETGKDFVMPVKTNRKTALTYDDRREGRYVRAYKAVSETDTPIKIFLEDADFPMLSVRQVFVNKDGSTGIPHLITGDTALIYEQIAAVCRKRRNAECYHKSLNRCITYRFCGAAKITAFENYCVR